MPTILIIQACIKRYRLPFFEQLHHLLRGQGIRLRVAYSEPRLDESTKCDSCDLPSEYGVKVLGRWLVGNKLVYQHVLPELRKADLVVVEQANKHLVNYYLHLLSMLKYKKVAFWGHGRIAKGHGLAEWLRKRTLNRVDWWFAYTDGTRRFLIDNGVWPSRITVVQNAIGTQDFKRQLGQVSTSDCMTARRALGIAPDARVGIFCGALVPEKRPDFIVDSAVKIRENVPNFELVIIGGGSEAQQIENAAEKHRWIHVLGPQFGPTKALWYRNAEVALMPAAVGLGILDAFAAGLPLVTTDFPGHGPEVEYLENGINGIVTDPDVNSYSESIVGLLSDSSRLLALSSEARHSARKYTIDLMSERFCEGALSCLRRQPLPSSGLLGQSEQEIPAEKFSNGADSQVPEMFSDTK